MLTPTNSLTPFLNSQDQLESLKQSHKKVTEWSIRFFLGIFTVGSLNIFLSIDETNMEALRICTGSVVVMALAGVILMQVWQGRHL